MKRLALFIILFVFASKVLAVDVHMTWIDMGAPHYKIAMSVDGGKRWDTTRSAKGNTFTWVMCPEDKMVLFKGAACYYGDCVWNNTEGAWYDHRLKTDTTGYPLITVEPDKTIVWEAKDGAIGYQLYFSSDGGNTYPDDVTLGNVLEYDYQGISTVFLYGCTIYESETSCRRWAGSWYKVDPSNEYGKHIFWHYRIKTFSSS